MVVKRDSSNNNIPLVSICCVTYNHENFIKECLDGFVMQQTSFPFEILVHEDASTDNTAKIVKEYESRYPHLFRCVYQTENQFLKQNTLINILFPMARGKYIAMCEGDDYWTDQYKLQKQIDYLEANKNYSLCFHQTMTLYDDGSQSPFTSFSGNKSFDFLDLTERPFISTPSAVFINLGRVPEWYDDVPGDWSLFLFIASHGKVYYMDECMAVYRRHSGGIWSSLSTDEMYQKVIKTIDGLDKAFNYEYHEQFEKAKELRYQIYYPPKPVIIKRSILSRVKRKVKSLLSSS